MRTSIAERADSVRTSLGSFFCRQLHGPIAGATAPEAEVNIRGTARSALGCPRTQEPEAIAQGVIRREEIPLLPRYGTSFGLFDERIADYECVLKSDAYQLGEYVGDSVQVSGPLSGVIRGMPVMEVTHLELLKMKWMG